MNKKVEKIRLETNDLVQRNSIQAKFRYNDEDKLCKVQQNMAEQRTIIRNRIAFELKSFETHNKIIALYKTRKDCDTRNKKTKSSEEILKKTKNVMK